MSEHCGWTSGGALERARACRSSWRRGTPPGTNASHASRPNDCGLMATASAERFGACVCISCSATPSDRGDLIMKPARVLQFVLAGVATLAIVGTAALAFLFYTNPGREKLRQMLVTRLNSQVTGRLTIGALEGALPNEVVLRDLALADSAGSLV